MNKPLIAVTMGDPSGIGPEIAARALLDGGVQGMCRPILIGDEAPLRWTLKSVLHSDARVRVITDISNADFTAPDVVNLYPLRAVKRRDYRVGDVSAAAGDAAFKYVRKAIELAMDNRVDATVTGPLCKESLFMAGHKFAGHTEIFAHFTGTKTYAMMLAHGNFRVAHVTTHVPLRMACEWVKRDRVLGVIRLARDACKQFGIESPRVAVAGLNPHCGEAGSFGIEEVEEILPAIRDAYREGINVSGPISPDTVFSKLRGGMYDICVCMYHDQGHIPIKLLGFTYDGAAQRWQSVSGVNITLGLPIIRVSVDHGTAFDIAGQGIASPESMISALDYATKMSQSRHQPTPAPAQ